MGSELAIANTHHIMISDAARVSRVARAGASPAGCDAIMHAAHDRYACVDASFGQFDRTQPMQLPRFAAARFRRLRGRMVWGPTDVARQARPNEGLGVHRASRWACVGGSRGSERSVWAPGLGSRQGRRIVGGGTFYMA